MDKIEQVARIICISRLYDPDQLEPGYNHWNDGKCPNGEQGHFMWREYTALAKKIIKIVNS
jgi:hypothetical protein